MPFSSNSSLRQRLHLRPSSLCSTFNNRATHSHNSLLQLVPMGSRTSLPSLQLLTRATLHRLHQHLLHSSSRRISLCLSPHLPSSTSSSQHNSSNNNNNRLVEMRMSRRSHAPRILGTRQRPASTGRMASARREIPAATCTSDRITF